MTIERAIEILDPEHREKYDGIEEVNEACRMAMQALQERKVVAAKADVDGEHARNYVRICEDAVDTWGDQACRAVHALRRPERRDGDRCRRAEHVRIAVEPKSTGRRRSMKSAELVKRSLRRAEDEATGKPLYQSYSQVPAGFLSPTACKKQRRPVQPKESPAAYVLNRNWLGYLPLYDRREEKGSEPDADYI